MGNWEWTPTAAFFVGVGVASLVAVFLAILAKIAVNHYSAPVPNGDCSASPSSSRTDSEVRSLNQRLQAIEDRLAVIERLQRQQLDAIHDTLPAS